MSDFVAGLHDPLVSAFADKPVLIAWPMKDVAFGPEVLESMWLADFPKAEVMRIDDAGH